MRYIKEILNKIKDKNVITREGESITGPHFEGRIRKTIIITLPILIILVTILIAIGITNAVNSGTETGIEQNFTEDADGYYIWVRAVDHAGNKRTLE